MAGQGQKRILRANRRYDVPYLSYQMLGSCYAILCDQKHLAFVSSKNEKFQFIKFFQASTATKLEKKIQTRAPFIISGV